MSTEIELKLQLSPKTAAALARHPLLAGLPCRKQTLRNTYYDTPELDLHTRKVAVRLRRKGGQWLCTVKSADPASGGLAVRNEWEAPATPGTLDFGHVDDDRLRHFLNKRIARLQAVFTTDFRRCLWHVPFGESTIELAIDRGHVASRGQRRPICEIELELLHGQMHDLFGLARQLQADHRLLPALTSKAERGYDLFIDVPPTPFKAKPSPLHAGQTPVEAFRSIALDCLEHFQRNEPGLTDCDNPEFVHQARVALRRLRSAIQLFAPVLPPEFVATYGKTWQTLAKALGETRDWDVFLHETLPPIAQAFPDDKDVKRLRQTAQRKTRSTRRTIAALLDTGEYPRLLLEFTAALYTVRHGPIISLEEFARRQILSRHKAARKLAILHNTASPTRLHKMRIAFKKLRYTLEFFNSLFGGKTHDRYLSSLLKLQIELGKINDQICALGFLAGELPSSKPGVIHGWVSGRHELLISLMEESLAIWLKGAVTHLPSASG